ncbi:MAG: carboxypeptidase regulatory-like domain-containing protein [Acidobacteria bacterium]|nr:carboxypeptidase regulatory-like domain-containing protein [Acidobacteriota bacterium]
MSGQARDTASLYGSVTDSQGGAVPGAKITVVNVATGLSRTASTDPSGGYVVPLLPVGTYTLTVELTGFRKNEKRNILLQANENILVNVALEVGSVQETVTVDAQSAQVDTRSATLNNTVDSKRIVELPLNGRNPADLVLLGPGVASGARNNNGNVGGSWRPNGQKEITVNGSRNNNLRYTLDGGTNMDDLVNGNMDFPFPNAVQEFSAQTSNMGVEHGGLSGGALNVVTKSGTNQIHGDAFWFVRNTKLNATNFFSRQQDLLKRNQFGFTLGGPILKNKLFAFGGYQRLTIRSAAGNSRDLTLTAVERRGDFSSNSIKLYDPLNPGQRFPNNQIPASRLAAPALKLLSFSPLPDAEGFVRYTISQPENGTQAIGKMDYVHSAKHSFLFRAFSSDNTTPYHSPADNIHAVRYGGFRNALSGTLGHTYILNAKTVVHTQITGAHQLANIATDFPFTTADLGVKLNAYGNHIDIGMDNSGVSFNRALHAIRFGRGSIEVQHDWTMSKGNHTMTWGFNVVRKRFNNNTLFHSSGQFSFDGHVTGFGNDSGFDRADFMLGGFSFFTQNSGEFEGRRGTQTGYYFGDTWRVRPGLTINLGLRYEPYGLFADVLDRNQTFDFAANKAGIRSAIFKNALPGLFYRGDKRPAGYGGGDTFGRTVTDPDYNNFAPRVGFAWDPFHNGKTSVRGGLAFFFDGPSLNAQNDANNVTPFSYSVEYTDGSFANPFLGREKDNIFPASAANHDVPFPAPLFTIVLDKKFITPYTQNWSLTVDRELVNNLLLRVGYVGTKATHLKTEYDQNAPIYNPNLTLAQNRANIDGRRPVKDFQTISRWMHGHNSVYHSLQISLDKRYSKGVTISTSYTWAKNLDYSSVNGFGGSRGINNPFNFFFSRGPSDLSRDHRFVNSFLWDLPALQKQSPVVRAVAGGWRLSGITSLQSGRPFSVGASNNPIAGAGSARADLVGSGYPVLDPNRSKGEKINQYLDMARFANPAPNNYGTLGRNVLWGPGFANIDASITKNWKLPFLREAGLIEYRFEAFNVLNATHLGQPVTGLTNPNRGKILSTDGDPRILQMALKVAW